MQLDPHDIPDFIYKSARANEHFKSLDVEVQAFFDTNPYDTVCDRDLETGDYLFRMRVLRQPPHRLALLIGDTIYNLRCVLDHLIWALSVHQDPNADSPTEFPIFFKKRSYRQPTHDGSLSHRSGLYKVRHLDKATQAAVESLQPYHQTDRTRAEHPLWLLHELSNADKHRQLHLVGVVGEKARIMAVSAENAEIVASEIAYGPAEDGAIIARVRVGSLDPNRSGKVNLNMYLSPTIAFSQRGPGGGRLVLPTLATIAQAVAVASSELCHVAGLPYALQVNILPSMG